MLNILKSTVRTGDKDFREVIKHSFWAYGLIGVAIASQFLFDLILSRTFGAEGTGLFYLTFSVLIVAALIGRLGFDRAVVRFLPSFLMQNKLAEAHGLQIVSIRLTLIMTLPLAAVLFVISAPLANEIFHKPELAGSLRIFAAAIPPLALAYVYAGLLRAVKRTRESLFVERAAIYVLGIVALLSLGVIFGLKGAFWGFVAAIYGSAIIGYVLTKRYLPRATKPKLFSKKVLLITSVPLLAVVFSNQMLNQANVLILGSLGSASDVGIFNIAQKVSLLMSMILAGIDAIMATKISELHASSKNLQTLVSKTAALGTIIAFPLFILIILAPSFILQFFGEEFVAGATVLIILAVGQMINVSVGSVSYLLAMTGHERKLAATVGATLLLNIALSLILIPAYGIEGAGIALGISIIVKNICLLYLVKRHLGVWSLPFVALKKWAGMANG